MRKEVVGLPQGGSSDVSSVQIYVEDCLSAVSSFAIYKIGKHGGYIEPPQDAFKMPFFDVAYGFNSVKTFVTSQEIKSQIESYVNAHLKDCTAGFSQFKKKGYNIKEGDVSSSVVIADKDIIITAVYPLKIYTSEKEFSIDKFQVILSVSLKKIYEENDVFLSNFNGSYNFSYLRKMNADVYILPFEQQDVIFEERKDSNVFGEDYWFLYALR